MPEATTWSRISFSSNAMTSFIVVVPSPFSTYVVVITAGIGMSLNAWVNTMRSAVTSRYSPENVNSIPSGRRNTWRYVPPGRPSFSATVNSECEFDSQRFWSSGVIIALMRRCFGAANTRVMWISLSPSIVTTSFVISCLLS